MFVTCCTTQARNGLPLLIKAKVKVSFYVPSNNSQGNSLNKVEGEQGNSC